jgi:hypothetical protein
MGRLQRGDRLRLQGEKQTSLSRWWRYACLPSTLSVLFLTGCSGFTEAIGNDPLLGGPPLRPSNAATPPSTMLAPALPPAAPNSTLSPAALAAGAPRPIDSGGDLRIGSPPSGGNDGWATGNNPASSIGQPVGGSGALLRPPEPLTQPPPRHELAPLSNPGSPRDNRFTIYEQAQEQMKARGVLWQRLEMVAETGEWKYSCSIPNRQNPSLRRTYEARASDSLAAIRAVLEQLDKDQ